MTSQKRGRHAVARRSRAGALARRSAHSAFLGTSAKVVFKIVSPRFCAFRPRRRVSAAPSRCARKHVKTPTQKNQNLKSKEAGFPRSAMARRSLRVATYLRCTLLTRPEHDLCRRSQILRIYWALRTHACAASSRDGATAAFSDWSSIKTTYRYTFQFSRERRVCEQRRVYFKTESHTRIPFLEKVLAGRIN